MPMKKEYLMRAAVLLLTVVLWAGMLSAAAGEAAYAVLDGATLTEDVIADEAEDITAECAFSFSNRKQTAAYTKRLTDGKYDTRWRQQDSGQGWLTMRTENADRPIASLYICFDTIPPEWEVQIQEGEDWTTVHTGDDAFYHVYVPLETPTVAVRVLSVKPRTKMQIAEIRAYAPGAIPSAAQVWEPPVEDAEILFLATHADDELIFFGGGIPTYATEKKKAVTVAYLANCGPRRRHELLNGLWSMGVRNHPVISNFPDKHEKTFTAEYKAMGGKNRVMRWVVSLYRRFRPEVVVTHDPKGEYGHVQHRVCAAIAEEAYDQAADPAFDPESAEAYGPWQVQKLYLHLGKENRIEMDWSVPLSSLGGITGLEAAVRAFTYHVSQQEYSMNVTKTGKQYDNRIFGLARTEVGVDTVGGDFLENIPPKAENGKEGNVQ